MLSTIYDLLFVPIVALLYFCAACTAKSTFVYKGVNICVAAEIRGRERQTLMKIFGVERMETTIEIRTEDDQLALLREEVDEDPAEAENAFGGPVSAITYARLHHPHIPSSHCRICESFLQPGVVIQTSTVPQTAPAA